MNDYKMKKDLTSKVINLFMQNFLVTLQIIPFQKSSWVKFPKGIEEEAHRLWQIEKNRLKVRFFAIQGHVIFYEDCL